MPRKIVKIISLGGSIIIPKTGFDVEFLQRLRAMILAEVKKGTRFVLVIGGGATCRAYQEALGRVRAVTNTELDWLGIATTHLNANFVRLLFGEHAHSEIVLDPSKKVNTKKPILVAGGWKPGHSTDYDAVLLAELYGATTVINLSNIDYVYDKDPRQFPDAKKFAELTWAEFKKIVGNKWSPGANVPFDPIATARAAKMGLEVVFAKGTDLEAVKMILQGKKFNGTRIK